MFILNERTSRINKHISGILIMENFAVISHSDKCRDTKANSE